MNSLKNDNRASESPGTSLPSNSPAIAHLLDQDGHIVSVTDHWLSVFGYERDEVIGRKVVDFLDPSSAAQEKLLIRDFTGSHALEDVSLIFRSRSGDPIEVEFSAYRLAGQTGTSVLNIGEITSIDGRSAAEDIAQRKSFRLQSCLEGTNAATWEWNVQTGQTRFNERWAEICGYTLDELAPISIDTWLSLAHPEDLTISEAALKRHFEGKADYYDIDIRMRHKDGRWVWVRDRGRVFTWTKDGQPEWMFGTHFSIDEEKTLAVERERNQRLLDRTGRAAGIGGWEVDVVTGEVLWTSITREIHGVDDTYKPTVADGIEFYAPEARPIIKQAVDTAFEHGTPWDLELPFIRKTGERIWVRAIGDIEWEDGRPRRLFGAFQDITERRKREIDLNNTIDKLKKAQEELRRSNEELDDFAYAASHDLKAPLRVIENASRWLEQDLEGLLDKESRENLRLLQSRVRRMGSLLNNLLEHSRIGRSSDKGRRMNGLDLIDDVLESIDIPSGMKVTVDPAFGTIEFYELPIRTVLFNLVANAVKHHHRDAGQITVSLQNKQDSLLFCVEDDGPGIDEAYHRKIFQMFQTLKPRDQVEGSGIGLAMVKKIVELAGGEVWLNSAEGEGSRFWVRLPKTSPNIVQKESTK